MNDREILFLLINKPDEGIYETTRKYGGLITKICYNILQFSPSDAEECVSDTLIRIWKNANKITIKNDTFKGYVIYAARCISIDRYRSLKRHNTTSLDFVTVFDREDLAENLETKEDVSKLKDKIEIMKEPDREIFIRRYFLFESIKNIALSLNMNEKAIESRLFRGRKKLANELTEESV